MKLRKYTLTKHDNTDYGIDVYKKDDKSIDIYIDTDKQDEFFNFMYNAGNFTKINCYDKGEVDIE